MWHRHGSVSPVCIALPKLCCPQCCHHTCPTPVTVQHLCMRARVQWSSAETSTTPTTPLGSPRIWPAVTKTGPHGQLEKLFITYWCQGATEATVAGGAQRGIRAPLNSNLLPASNRAATVPRQTPARLQDWVCWV